MAGEHEGHRVVVLGMSTVGRAISRGFAVGGAAVLELPVSQPSGSAAARSVAEQAVRHLGGVDIVVRHAPVTQIAPALALTGQAWNADMDSALHGAWFDSQAFAELMAQGSGGSIVFVGSVDAYHAYPRRVTAAVAMAGLLGLTRALAVELAQHGIRINAVIQGPVDDLGSEQTDHDGLARTKLRSPAHRLGAVDEIAAAVMFVAGPRASYMTGQALRVDGGWSSLNSATVWSRPAESMAWTS